MLSQVGFYFRRMDWGAFLAQALLLTIGVFFIYSAAYRGDPETVSPFYKKQVIWIVLGLLAFFLAMRIDYSLFSSNAYVLYAIGLVLLVLVLFIGTSVHGAYRWINIGPIKIQPAEIAKITTLLALARFLARPGRNAKQWKVLLHGLLIVAVPFLLIVKQPDLGTAMVLIPTALVMLFVAGVRISSLLILGVIGLMLLPFGWFTLSDYQQNRILVFLDPGKDPLGAGWNKLQSEIAVGSGGLTGKGYLLGTQNILGFLPRTVAPTDFIFPVIAEETGFVGGAFVMGLFALLLIAVIRTALASRDKFGRLLAAGVAAILFSHVFVNIAMTIGLMPITGLPLPLISYGGSFTVSILIGLGMVQSVFVRRYRR